MIEVIAVSTSRGYAEELEVHRDRLIGQTPCEVLGENYLVDIAVVEPVCRPRFLVPPCLAVDSQRADVGLTHKLIVDSRCAVYCDVFQRALIECAAAHRGDGRGDSHAEVFVFHLFERIITDSIYLRGDSIAVACLCRRVRRESLAAVSCFAEHAVYRVVALCLIRRNDVFVQRGDILIGVVVFPGAISSGFYHRQILRDIAYLESCILECTLVDDGEVLEGCNRIHIKKPKL